MSRTAFAVTFKERVGLSPMHYLTRWRIMQAADRLTSTRQSLAEIGLALGYESEKSFGTAFERAMNCRPVNMGAGKARNGFRRFAPLPAVAVILFAPSGEVPDQFAAVRRFIRRPDGPLERLQEQERVAAVHGARRPSDMAGER